MSLCPMMYLQQQKLLELTSLRESIKRYLYIYNSRNYQSLLARFRYWKNLNNLQQQKLLELTSLLVDLAWEYISTIVEIIRAYQPVVALAVLHIQIYNSRNYQSLLALGFGRLQSVLSTIVEIIRAYQPTARGGKVCGSTIVEIIRAYQPGADIKTLSLSTIVEIIRAYQPS